MAFDEQLTHAFETLTERLRHDVGLQVQQTSAELIAAARADQERAATAVALTAREAEAFVAAARRDSHDEGFAAGRAAGRRELEAHAASRAVDVGSADRLADAVRAIERARSLTAVLDALVTGARTEDVHADVWLIRGDHLHRWRAQGPDDAGNDHLPARPLAEGGLLADAARMNAVAAADGSLAVPIALAGQVVAILLADGGTEHADARTQRLELLTSYAARCLEALTAFTIARALTTTQPAAPHDPDETQSADGASAEEDTSARRYARLLVSEIKLYHEPAVIDGRRDRDLAARLGGEITRARVMYEQRVPPHVRERADYFHDELVRTLADGDASLLNAEL